MPFNGAGVYAPPGADYPVTPNTLIESAKYNDLVADVATALGLCLTKDGQQTVTANIPLSGFALTNARLRALDGLVGTPGITFDNDTDCGFYRIGANSIGLAIAGALLAQFDAGNFKVVGTAELSQQLKLSGVLSPAQIVANTNDYAPANFAIAAVLRLNSDARRSLTGLTGGADGRVVKVFNTGTFPILFKLEDAGSTAANRFSFGHTLSGGHTLTLMYDGTTARWRCTAKEHPAGTLMDFAGGTVPEGWLARDGSNVSRATYAALFNEVGTAWGAGDGVTTFGVGDSRRRTDVGSGGSGTGTLANTTGSTGGEETHVLLTGELATHSHTPTYNNITGIINAGATGLAGGGSAAVAVSITIGNAGSDTAHNNIQPSCVVTKLIKI